MSNRPPTVSNSFKSRQIEVTDKLTVTGIISSTGSAFLSTLQTSGNLNATGNINTTGNINATGNINTTGSILSGGVNLINIFSSAVSNSGIQTLTYSEPTYILTISQANSVNLSSINSTFAANSGKYEGAYTVVNSTSSNWNTGYGVAVLLSSNQVSTAINYLSTNNVTISSLVVTQSITASSSNIPVTVIDTASTRTFTNSDTNKVIHFNTTSDSLCAIFPNNLAEGFNVAIMNTGTNSLVVSASNLKSTGTSIIDQYGSAFVYKQNNNVFAVGKLY